MPLGSLSTLGLAGPYGTPLIGELPAPADPAGGVSCARACPGRHKPPSTARTSTVIRDIRSSVNFNDETSRSFPADKTVRSALVPCQGLGWRLSQRDLLPPPNPSGTRSTPSSPSSAPSPR